MTDLQIADSLQQTGANTVDAVVGGGALALDVVRRPRTTARRAVRRGAEVTDEAQAQVSSAVDTTLGMPERLLTMSLRRIRRQAGRQDVVGAAARALLTAVNRPAADAAGFFSRVERETELPRGTRRGRSTRSRRSSGTSRKAAGHGTGRTGSAATGRRTPAAATGRRTAAAGTTRRTTTARGGRRTAGRRSA